MQTIRLSTVPGVVNAGVNLSQYDVGRQIGFLLYDESGAYTPPAGATAKIRATKPSGFAFDEQCTISGNTVTVAVTATMSAESGIFPAEIRITKDSEILGTGNFLWHVERAPRLEGAVDGNEEARELMQELLEAIAIAEAAGTSVYSILRLIVTVLRKALYREDMSDLIDQIEELINGSSPEPEPPAEVEITQEGTVLIFTNVPDIESITQSSSVLILL